MITKEQVEKALEELEISKASEQDLDQPEGADLGAPGEKMSDAAPGPDKSKKKKKVKKSDDGEEKDKQDDEEEDEEMEESEKSFNDLPEEIETKIDVSEFLKSLVEHTATSIDGISKAVETTSEAMNGRYDSVLEVVEDVQKSQAKIGIVLKALCEKVGIIENAPATEPKADRVAKSEGTSVDRTFKSGLEEEEEGEAMFKSLDKNPHIAKSQISNALCELVKKGEATDVDVIGFESNSYIRPDVVEKLKTVLD